MTEAATPEREQRRAFRAFVRAHHPDVGGDAVAFVAGLARYRAAAGDPDQADARFDAPVLVVPGGWLATAARRLSHRMGRRLGRRHRPRVH